MCFFRISGFQDSASYFQSINLSREIFCRKQLGTVAPSIPRMVMLELCSFENKFSPVLHVKKRSFAVHLCFQYLRNKKKVSTKKTLSEFGQRRFGQTQPFPTTLPPPSTGCSNARVPPAALLVERRSWR